MSVQTVSAHTTTAVGSSQRSASSESTTKEETYRRLIITKLVNDNFKSYAGIQEIGPFHKVTTMRVNNY
jgi:structural maintenance of chromosome 4